MLPTHHRLFLLRLTQVSSGGSADAAQLMAQMWQGHGSLLSSAAARLKEEAVTYRLRQALDPSRQQQCS